MGFDGLMLNEHHSTPFCMGGVMNVEACILARITQRSKIVLLGNVLPIWEDPLWLAEMLAEIDMISHGRLVTGWVRGTGRESVAHNAQPPFNWERFQEAHDFVVKAWTTPGPFRWEGEHYQYRVVNPWARVLQKPHPRIWVPGVFSPETIAWAAEHRYPYVALNTPMHLTPKLWETYDEAARRVGYEPGPENRGYLLRTHVADTDAKAEAGGRQFMWMRGEFTGIGHPYWVSPSGYGSPDRDKRLMWAKHANAMIDNPVKAPFEQQSATREIVWGTPNKVIDEVGWVLETCRPSILMLWGNDGHVGHADSMRCIELLGERVVPELRKIGDSLGLHSPIELDTPVSLRFTPPEDLVPRAAGA
jgi:alkanesulfonate monooxygenase SsuD/methylene tetrahydromethanopterin reductase-like flavin-dependent oxidoreductase (luciferase family)